MEDSGHMLGPDAAIYTEAIHTNADVMGHGGLVAHSDFFPNGGEWQPGCGANFVCSHYRYIINVPKNVLTKYEGRPID